MLQIASHNFELSPEHGRLVVEGPEIYSAFFSAGAYDLNTIFGRKYYNYGLVEATNAERMVRTDIGRRLIPDGSGTGRINQQFHNNILIVPKDDVDYILKEIGEHPHTGTLPRCNLAAERLFRTVMDRQFGGIILGACGTYEVNDTKTELVIVDQTGGISIGGDIPEEVSGQAGSLTVDTRSVIARQRRVAQSVSI